MIFSFVIILLQASTFVIIHHASYTRTHSFSQDSFLKYLFMKNNTYMILYQTVNGLVIVE